MTKPVALGREFGKGHQFQDRCSAPGLMQDRMLLEPRGRGRNARSLDRREKGQAVANKVKQCFWAASQEMPPKQEAKQDAEFPEN